MTSQGQTSAKPTNSQLAFIRELNSKTGTEFSYPGTVGQARQEIERLTALAECQELAIARFTKLGEDSGLPMFDEVVREGAAVRFVWNDRKVMVVIDLDDDPTDPAGAAAAIAAWPEDSIMAHTTKQTPGAVKLCLRCPKCGSAEVASIEQLTASCQGRATLTIEPGGNLHAEFHPGGWTDVNWDSSTTVGVQCRSCVWSYRGADYLDQLTFEIREAC